MSEEEKEEYERTFVDEEGKIPEVISSSELNTWIFNEDTIRQALNILMTEGIKIEYGQKLGKTIIFAKNHNHAEKILEVFNKEYPYLPDYARVIDNRMTYAQSAIDEFADPKKMPQIAISVDMLDTGIDVPEILNLVFFKKVMSKAKFWQMIGYASLSGSLFPGCWFRTLPCRHDVKALCRPLLFRLLSGICTLLRVTGAGGSPSFFRLPPLQWRTRFVAAFWRERCRRETR